MDNQTSLLVSSVVINILLIIERFLKRITKSECCFGKMELEKSKSEINLSNIKVIDEPLSNIKHIEGKTLDSGDEQVKSI